MIINKNNCQLARLIKNKNKNKNKYQLVKL